MRRLEITVNGYPLHAAGLPHFPRFFARDALLSALILAEAGQRAKSFEILQKTLPFCLAYQGKKKDPFTGELPGKVPHECPGVILRDLSTLYNACDSTTLFLIALELYLDLTGNQAVLLEHRESIKEATDCILSHVKEDGLFWEDPSLCGASRFALKVTYWKDSQLPREREEPLYPVVYTLAHFQNAAGLRSAARMSGSRELFNAGSKMIQAGLEKLWGGSDFFIGLDQNGPISGPSSDSLHLLYYLSPADIRSEWVVRIVESTKTLETPFGYLALAPGLAENVVDDYHARIWPWEHALIYAAAEKHNLTRVQEVSSRVLKGLEMFPNEEPETLIYNPHEKTVSTAGCQYQLWTWAAKAYLESKIPLPVSVS
jgi:glycogen debranching enzyme